MATIKRYRPSYFVGFDNETNEFNSLEELLKIDWVNNFKVLGDTNISFHQFSVSKTPYYTVLMAEYIQGTQWWVVGFIEGGDDIIKELPKWEAKEKS